MSAQDNTNAETVACWVGIDVSKDFFDAAIAGSEQRFPSTSLKQLPCERFKRTQSGVKALLQWVDKHAPEGARGARAVMETTGKYSLELTAWLIEERKSMAPAIVNAGQVKSFVDSLGQRNKTDGLAARGLAFFGVERRPSPYELMSPERRELRELTRYRAKLVEERTALKNRIKEGSSSKTVSDMWTRQLEELNRDIKELEQGMEQLRKAHSPFKRDFALLTSIPGVGFITAMVVLAELGDLRRFERAKQLSAFTGLNPRIIESGTSVRAKTRMGKRGNRHVRQALYTSSMGSLLTKASNDFKVKYTHLCDQGKAGKAALGAVMRQQLLVMRAVVINETPYDPLWKTRQKQGGNSAQKRPCTP